MANKPTSFSFLDTEEILPTIPLNIGHLLGGARNGGPAAATGMDLTGKRKVVFLCGSGQTGKTTLARWIGDRAITEGKPLILIAMDPINRDLAPFFAENTVLSPPDGVDSKGWFESVLNALEKKDRSAIVDFGGGDKVLLDLVNEIPGFHQTLEDAGLSPVALHFFTKRVSDRDLMAALEHAGFQPEATGLVLNCGQVENPKTDFNQLRRDPVYQAVLDRGGVELWMPLNHAAAEVENRRIGFSAANDVVSRRNAHRNKDWQARMTVAFGGVSSWLA